MKNIRVLIADDHSIVRAGLRALIETAGDMTVVGEAEDGRQAVLQTEQFRPDVVLLDIAMPLLNGLGSARRILKKVPTTRVLILSSYNDPQHLRQAVESGVSGYLLKESASTELLEAIRKTTSGAAAFSPFLVRSLFDQCSSKPDDAHFPQTKASALSARHMEVLQLIAEGHSTKQIAGLLCLQPKTIEKHRQTLMERLDIHTISQLTRFAAALGVVEISRSPVAPEGNGSRNPVRVPPGL